MKATLDYAPITTTVMLKAAELWAQARRAGRPTAAPDALDADCIYKIPSMLHKEKLDEIVCRRLEIDAPAADLSTWDLWAVDIDGKVPPRNLSSQDETSAEVIHGLELAFDHYKTRTEVAWSYKQSAANKT